jgi:hypothetical protein
MNNKAYTLKDKSYGLRLDWIIAPWRSDTPPTHEDFQNKYGDAYYPPFHKDEEIVELCENPQPKHLQERVKHLQDEINAIYDDAVTYPQLEFPEQQLERLRRLVR